MSEQEPVQTATATQQKPVPEGYATWNEYWSTQGMPWRTEPEIDEVRRGFLAGRRAIRPDITQGVYRFKDIMLDRADVEWLLATHESGGMVGPVSWSDAKQREREGVDLRGANLRRADLRGLPLARLRGGPSFDERERTPLRMREVAVAHMEEADVSAAHLERASLSRVHFEGALLRGAHLLGADLFHAQLQGTTLTGAHLEGADLRFAFFGTAFNTTTYLRGVLLTAHETGPCLLAGVRWGDVDLSLVHWSQLSELGDERWARQLLDNDGKPKARAIRLEDYQAAVRANRRLAAVLRDQGLNEDADRFAYRAQLLQRVVLRRQGHWLRYLGSLFLGIVAGYGYRPMRSFLAYALVVLGFAAGYYVLGGANGQPLPWNEAIVVSMTAFHGRGFFSAVFQPGDLQAAVAAVEAFIGLLIEIVLIATFTNQFFAR